MSLLDEKIACYNAENKISNKNSDAEHMQWLETQRIAAEEAIKNSTKGAWERLHAKRRSDKNKSQVLGKLLLVPIATQN
jgi:hypothetical protein